MSSPLQEIIKTAQEIQRDLETLSLPSGKGVIVEPGLNNTFLSVDYTSKASDTGEQLINDAQLAAGLQASLDRPGLPNLDEAEPEAVVIEDEVVTCKPCRVYTHGQEKPEWAIRGCSGNGHRNKVILLPQLPASEKPATKQWGSKIRQNEGGFSCIHPECQQYDKIFPKKSAAQQHAKKHYPPEYRCSDCDGEWYLKSEYNQHFLIPCPHCDKLFMKGSLPGHLKYKH